MGASLVLRRLKRCGDPQTLPHLWLEAQSHGAGDDWQRVRGALESELSQPNALADASAAARAAFATVALGVGPLTDGRRATIADQVHAS